MSTFTYILNRECEGFMVLELVLSFSNSFRDSFSGSSLSPDFPADLISKFEPPTYMNGLIFLARANMKRDILQYISKTFSFILTNISYTRSRGFL
jgi:hypothetical protein